MKTISFTSVHNPTYVIGYINNVVLNAKIISIKKVNNKYSYVIKTERENKLKCLMN